MRTRLSIIVLFLTIPVVSGLSCDTYESGGSGTLIMRLSDSTNAHAEVPSQSNYGWNVYCSNASFTITTECDTVPLYLSGSTNAHAANSSIYPVSVCIGVEETGIECISSNGSLPSEYECLTTLSDTSNAHLASCSNPYDIRIGCKFTDTGPPTWANNITNETESTPRYNEPIMMNVTLYDDLELGSYVFSWNDSGTWTNDSSVSISGTEHIVSRSKTVTSTRGDIIGWKVYFEDALGNSNVTDVFSFEVKNTPPTVPVLDRPLNGDEFVVNRTPRFNWTESTDVDSDTITYRWYLALDETFQTIVTSNTTVQSPFYIPQILDSGTYFWRVSAFDGYETSDNSTTFVFTLVDLISVELVNNAVDFGQLDIGQIAETSGTPEPMIVRNAGNIPINVSVNSTPLWQSEPLSTRYFQTRVRELERSAFNQESVVEYTDMKAEPTFLIGSLRWEDDRDEAFLDLRIEVPLDENPGNRTATIVVDAS